MNSDPDFRAAHAAGARGVSGVAFPLVFLVFLAFLGAIVQPFPFFGGSESTAGSAAPPLFLAVLGLMAVVALFMFFAEVGRRARSRGAWSRAARGAVSLTLRGEAVDKQRRVSGRPMRTVVVQHDGEQRYLHLLFAEDASVDTMRRGPVSVEFFAGDDVEGPARILLPDGRTLWSFTTRLGERPQTEFRGRARSSRAGSSDDGGAGMVAPAIFMGTGPHGRDHDRDRDRDQDDDGYDDGGSGDGFGDSAWSAGDGWTGGSSWGGDSTWSGSDGGSSSGGGGGWFGGDSSGGWSGGDSGGGGGDSGGGGGS